MSTPSTGGFPCTFFTGDSQILMRSGYSDNRIGTGTRVYRLGSRCPSFYYFLKGLKNQNTKRMKKYVTFSHFPPFAHFSIIKLWKLIITVFSSVLQVKIYNDFSFFQTWSDVVFRIRAFFFRLGFFLKSWSQLRLRLLFCIEFLGDGGKKSKLGMLIVPNFIAHLSIIFAN